MRQPDRSWPLSGGRSYILQELLSSLFIHWGEVALRFRFLAVEWIDLAASKHVCQDQIFQHLDSLRRSCFIIVAERLEEIFTSSIPLS